MTEKHDITEDEQLDAEQVTSSGDEEKPVAAFFEKMHFDIDYYLEPLGMDEASVQDREKTAETQKLDAEKALEITDDIYSAHLSDLLPHERFVEFPEDVRELFGQIGAESFADYAGDEKVVLDSGIVFDSDGDIDQNFTDDRQPLHDKSLMQKVAAVHSVYAGKVYDTELTSRILVRFKIEDEDAEELDQMSDAERDEASVFFARMLLINRDSPQHLKSYFIEDTLIRLLKGLVKSEQSTSEGAGQKSGAVSEGLMDGMSFTEKLRFFNFAIFAWGATTAASEPYVMMAAAKVFQNFTVSDDDVQWIVDNVGADGEHTADLLDEETLSDLLSGKFSHDDYVKRLTMMMWGVVLIPAMMSAVQDAGNGGVPAFPRVVRDHVYDQGMRGLAAIGVATGGNIGLPGETWNEVMQKLEEKLALNEKPTVSEQFFAAVRDLTQQKESYRKVFEKNTVIVNPVVEEGEWVLDHSVRDAIFAEGEDDPELSIEDLMAEFTVDIRDRE